jgi:hypothetical protein
VEDGAVELDDAATDAEEAAEEVGARLLVVGSWCPDTYSSNEG